jgi:hypothetical protein
MIDISNAQQQQQQQQQHWLGVQPPRQHRWLDRKHMCCTAALLV